LRADEFERFQAWIKSYSAMSEYLSNTRPAIRRGGIAFGRLERGVQALSFFVRPWSGDIALDRIFEAGVGIEWARRIILAAGPPTLVEIVAAASARGNP
jgi:hypothetical protein